MKNWKTAGLAMAALSFSLGSSVRAEEGATKPIPAQDLDWEKRIENNRRKRNLYISEQRARKLTRVEKDTRRFVCRLESLLDGTLMISKPYDRSVEPLLLRFGHRKLNRPPEHVDRVLYDGRSYQVFLIREEVPLWKVEKYIGQEVELELEKFIHSGMVRVVRIRELSRPEGRTP